MISRSVYDTDVRVRREARALVGAGHQVSFLGLGSNAEPEPGIRVLGIGEPGGLRGAQPRSAGVLYRSVRWALLPNHREAAIRQFEKAVVNRFGEEELAPDIVHAHDLPALAAGATIADSQKAYLIYDAHELWAGMARHGRPSPLERRSMFAREGELSRRADAVITVSDGAAQKLIEWHDLRNVTVVRNTFPARTDLTTPTEPYGAVYSGRITKSRDLETVFTAFRGIEAVDLHLIGPRDGSLAIPSTAILHEEADLTVVEALIAEAGIGLVPLVRGPLNHDVALPNKLFESVAVGAPVVAADLPEIRRIIEEHAIGALYRPGDPAAFVSAIRSVIAEYPALRDSVDKARVALDWSLDARALLKVYADLAVDKHGTGHASH